MKINFAFKRRKSLKKTLAINGEIFEEDKIVKIEENKNLDKIIDKKSKEENSDENNNEQNIKTNYKEENWQDQNKEFSKQIGKFEETKQNYEEKVDYFKSGENANVINLKK